MSDLKILQEVGYEPKANPKSIIKKYKLRFTILTSRIIRIEYDETSNFLDKPSQIFWFRNQNVPEFSIIDSEDKIEIITDFLHLVYFNDGEKLNSKNLFIYLKEMKQTWHYGDNDCGNLKGTARTLDNVDGKIQLKNGLISKDGWTIINDSDSLILDKFGWINERDNEEIDFYFFGYGLAYQQCLKDFCKISGPIPLIPRWALGNWWSRYWEYTQEELKKLMDAFEEREIPLKICIIDMDWHIVKIQEYLKKHNRTDLLDVNYHDGWTGFTWNEDLFPDYKALLHFLHYEKDLRVALNLHPAKGIYPHEKQYRRLSQFMGIDPASKEPIEFDLTNPRFSEAYFQIIYHPYEKEGIDFWWTDWQQGNISNLKGLDPLWWINHLSFYDSGRNKEKRPFIFSRWGGIGNHRYPIGFSGDTFATWDVLSFLPYFTATASNIAYTWWSHDLGGHMGGRGFDPELYVRWIQFGLFSPIFRLHSTKNPFNERLPWMFNKEVFNIAQNVMQLRHTLIPYIYSMAWKTYSESFPLIRPIYYEHPDEENAYHFPNQYYFGTELICAPYVSKIDEDIGQSRQIIWLPEGIWFDYFSGEYHEGNQILALYGLLEEIPVFARSGAIIPLADYQNEKKKWSDTSNPLNLQIMIFPGKNNTFELYEDDGVSQEYLTEKFSITKFQLEYTQKQLKFKIQKPISRELYTWIPRERTYILNFLSVNKPDIIKVKVNGAESSNVNINYFSEKQKLKITDIKLKPSEELEVHISISKGKLMNKKDFTLEKSQKLLKYLKLDSTAKMFIYDNLEKVIKSSKKLTKFFDTILMGLKPKENAVSSKDFEFLERIMPLIKMGNLIEEVLFQTENDLIKNKLYNLNLNNMDEAKNSIWDVIQKSFSIKSILSMKENQMKALLEISQDGRAILN